jgi:hypothetical protein
MVEWRGKGKQARSRKGELARQARWQAWAIAQLGTEPEVYLPSGSRFQTLDPAEWPNKFLGQVERGEQAVVEKNARVSVRWHTYLLAICSGLLEWVK